LNPVSFTFSAVGFLLVYLRAVVLMPVSFLRIFLPLQSVNSGLASKKRRFATAEKWTDFVSCGNDLEGRGRVRPIKKAATRDTYTFPREVLLRDSNASSSGTRPMGLVLESFLVATVVECVTSRAGSAACHGGEQQKESKFECLLLAISAVIGSDVAEAKVGKLSGEM
jgi:hypothetical protein